MNTDQREIQRKLRILIYAEETGHVAKTRRYFGIGRTSFYRWGQSYEKYGEDGLINRPTVPKWHANRTPIEIEEKVLHLRRVYHLGPMRIVWHLRHQNIRRDRLTNVETSWRQPASSGYAYAQGPHKTRQQAGAGTSHPDGR